MRQGHSAYDVLSTLLKQLKKHEQAALIMELAKLFPAARVYVNLDPRGAPHYLRDPQGTGHVVTNVHFKLIEEPDGAPGRLMRDE